MNNPLQDENAAMLDIIEELCRASVHTNPGNKAAGDRKTVACLPIEAAALELSAANHKFIIISRYGKTLTGYWPENKPTKENQSGE